MVRTRGVVLLLITAAVGAAAAPATAPADGPAQAPKPPAVAGAWTGVWGPFSPALGATLDKDKCKQLDCQVVLKDGVWQATFEGECGRPYQYTIKMEGRQAGGAVMFKGTVDLGEKDGGVYDWIGRASEQEFVGFYTSARYTGAFRLARVKTE
jgi:hypothetical protein